MATIVMDKKAKKKLEVLHKRMVQVQQQLAGARKQKDDEREIQNLETQVAQLNKEIDRLKSS